MFNLVEVQTALQSPSVQLADLMKYANGSSAEVPAYLALGELNRRKQLEATNTAFNATPPTVKDQLTNAPPAVNPTAAPQGIAPTATPPQLAATTAAPPRMNVAAAPANQVNPIAPPQMAAEGGLLSIPTPHMFKQESYANGGIVAFSGTDESYVAADPVAAKLNEKKAYGDFRNQDASASKKESVSLSKEVQEQNDMLDRLAILEAMRTNSKLTAAQKQELENTHTEKLAAKTAARHAATAAASEQDAASRVAPPKSSYTDKPAPNPNTAFLNENLRTANNDESLQGIMNIPGQEATNNLNVGRTTSSPVNIRPEAVPQGGIPDTLKAGYQAPAPVVAPVTSPVAPAAPTGIAPSANAEMTPAERHARLLKQMEYAKEERAAAGISDDPHKDTRDRMDKLEAKRAAQEAEDPFNSLMARLAAYGSSKEQTFGGGMGDSAIAGAKLSKETAALRDKQATEIIAARQAMETAEDARKRGDLTAVKAAEESAEKHTEKFKELGIQQQQADASRTQANAAELHANSEAAWKQFDEETKRIVAEAAMRHARNPELTEGQRKANAIKDIMTLKKVDFLEATRLYAIAENAGKLEGLDEKLHQQNLKGWNDLKIAGQSIYNSRAKKEGQGRSGRDLFMEERGEAPSQPAGIPTVSTPTARKVPTQASVDFLMKHPNTIAEFDAKFGAGSAATYLGRNTAIPIQDVQRQKEQY